MSFTAAEAVLVCVALLGVDFTARTLRMQVFLRGIGRRVSFREVLLQSFVCEAGAILTPMRIGGDATRLWAMRQAGLSMTAAVVCMGVETLAMAVVIVSLTLVLMLTVAADWWEAVGPRLLGALADGWPWVALVVFASLVGWLIARHFAPRLRSVFQREARSVRRYARVMPRWAWLAAVPLTLVNIGARVAILPVLVSTLHSPPPLVATIIGSYALLYGQLLTPTPAGAGAVELGFLAGAAGELGVEEGRLLLMWRAFTTLLPLLFGIAVAVLHYGFRLFGAPDLVIRRRDGKRTQSDAATDSRRDRD